MPVNIDFYDFKCWNQLRNGADFSLNTGEFTPNLVGNVGEKLKVEFKARVTQSAFTEGVDEWEILNAPAVKEIRRSSGSFIDDSIQVGDVFEFYADWENRKTTNQEYNGTVEFISSDGKTLKYSVNSLTDSTNGTVQNVGLSFDQRNATNINTALFLKFGLIENAENFNFLSKTSGSQQVYYRGGLTILTSNTELDASALGSLKDWVSGNCTVEINALATDFNDAEYIIRHEFILNPFYIVSFREFIENKTVPALFEGANSLKYAAAIELRKSLTNTGSTKENDFDDLDGFTGWYNENFNGLNADYEVVSVAYEDTTTNDPINSININNPTKVTITVSKLSGAITDYSCGVYVIKVPDNEEDYQGTTSDIPTNFVYKSAIVSNPATTAPNISTSIVGGNLVIEYELSYSAAEQLMLNSNDEFLLLVQVEDPTLSAGDSDRIMLIAEFTNFIEFNALFDFVSVFNHDYYQHGEQIGVDTPRQSIIVSNEDGILLDGLYGTDQTKNAVINSVSVKLLAFNGAQSFELDNYEFNIGPPEIVGGVQQINVDTTRGYTLAVGDQFNLAKIVNAGASGNFETFTVQIGQKVKWQDWIFNPAVPSDFFNAAFPNDNRNFKGSNYSNEQNYEIYVAVVFNVAGEDTLGRSVTGEFISYGLPIKTNDYDESENSVSGVITTFDIETGQSLDGAVLYNGKDTLFQTVFQNATDIGYAIHRIEPSENQGDGIQELSSIVNPASGILLKGLSGATLLDFDKVGSVLTTQCIIDGNLIDEGVDYKLSARAGDVVPPPPPPPACDVNANSGGVGITEYVYPLDPAGGIYLFDCTALGVPDKWEILHNGFKVATTGMTVSNSGPFDDTYPISNVTARTVDQFIGTTSTVAPSIPTRLGDFVADTGFILDGSVENQQLIWFQYTPADYLADPNCVLRVTGPNGTAWRFKRRCQLISAQTIFNIAAGNIDNDQAFLPQLPPNEV
jgi:predicted  nucleic acid-binding Zn-ribbon protein